MLPRTLELFTGTANAIAELYQRFTGWNVIRTSASTYEDWWHPLPPQETADTVNGVPIQALVRQAHVDKGTCAESVVEAWNFVAATVKDAGWPRTSAVLPVLEKGAPGAPLTARAGEASRDVRGVLAQWLLAAHQGVPASFYEATTQHVRLVLEGHGELFISANSISWPGGHYLNRKSIGRSPIDFNQWVGRPLESYVRITSSSAAIMRKLQGVLPAQTLPIQHIFVLAAIVGPECEALLRAPFEVQYHVPRQPDDSAAQALLHIQELIRG